MLILNTWLLIGTPRWGQRAQNMTSNAVVFMLEDGIISKGIFDNHSNKKQHADWCKGLVGEVITAAHSSKDASFIPILHSHDLEALQSPGVQSLYKALGAKADNLPRIYYIHGASKKAIPYPVKLSEMENYNAEAVLSWI